MQPTSEAAFRLRRTSYDKAATDDPAFTWQAAYSTVAGTLPLPDIPEVRVRNRVAKGGRGVGFIRCEFLVSTPGRFLLVPNSITGLTCWVNDKPQQVRPEIALELPRGRHRLTLAVDQQTRTEPLQIMLRNVENSPAQVQLIGGK